MRQGWWYMLLAALSIAAVMVCDALLTDRLGMDRILGRNQGVFGQADSFTNSVVGDTMAQEKLERSLK